MAGSDRSIAAKGDRRFVRLARRIAKWSKDPKAQVGAVLLNRHGSPVALGYNKTQILVQSCLVDQTNGIRGRFKIFNVHKKARLLAISCVHFAGETPFCHEDRRINLDVVPQAEHVDFHKIAPGHWLRIEVPWSTAEHAIYAVAADEHLSRELHVPRHSPCLVVQRRTWSEQGAVTFVRLTYRAEKHAIIARFTPASTARPPSPREVTPDLTAKAT